MKNCFWSICLLLLLAVICIPQNSNAQVDPAWLRSWNEAVENQPANIASQSRIASEDEAGEPFIIQGQVYTPDGKPANGVVVHAYHRDEDGFDFGPNDRATSTWRLQGWVETDENGQFEFRTIKPRADHMGREAAHIHFTTVSDAFGRQWAPKVFLSDDPLVTDKQRKKSAKAGDFGKVRKVQTQNGIQYIQVNIRLKDQADF